MQDEETELTFGELLRIVCHAWRILALFTAGGVVIAIAVAFLTSPVYRAETLLASATSEPSEGSTLARLAGQFAPLAGLVNIDASGGLEAKEVRLATLSSRRLTESFIQDRNLMPLLFPTRWDAGAGRWKLKDGKPWAPTMGAAVDMFDSKIRKVSEDRRTGLVTLAIEWRDREAAATWANDLVSRANESLRARAIEEASSSIAFLESELAKTNVVERRQIIYRLVESKTSDIMMANARKEYAFVVVDPATAPEPGDYVRPRYLVILVTGLLFGLLVGIIFATIRSAWNSSQADVTGRAP